MKLSNSEILLLTQVLYHVRCSDSYFEFGEQIHDLHNKFCSHLLSDKSSKINSESTYHGDEECVWHDHHVHDDDLLDSKDEFDEEISLKDLLQLDPMRATYKGKKSSVCFEKGISNSSLDLNLDDGDEILCDVTHVERHAEELKIQYVSGWTIFDVQKFPKSWTALLQPGVLYKVI